MLKHCVILLFCMLTFSCTSYEDWRGESAAEDLLRIRITSLSATRATAGYVENTVRDVKYFLFDDEGSLEATYTYSNYPDKEVVFEHLTKGRKTLVLLANSTDTTCIDPMNIPDGIKKQEFDSLMVSMRAPYVFTNPKSIPMFYESELDIPAEDPVVNVTLNRLFVRLKLKNDIENGTFAIDSLTFRGLNSSVYVTNNRTQKTPDIDQTLRNIFDSVVTTSYILPAAAQQIEYSVYGRNLKGVQQIIKGHVNPELKKNNSYTLSLSTGEIVEDGVPKNLEVIIDNSVGTYSPADSTIVLKAGGGNFSIAAESLDSLEIVSGDVWLKQSNVESRAERFPTTFNLISEPYITADDTRMTTLSIQNKYDKTKSWSLHIRQTGENSAPKYYVIAIAGQSNASGRDLSSYDAQYDAPSPRIFELGKADITPPFFQKYDSQSSTLSIVPLYYVGQNLDANIFGRAKSLHLPLGKEILKHIPDDYNVLVVSVCYSGAGFSLLPNTPLGDYDPVEMRTAKFPADLPGTFRFKAREGVLYNMLTDRVKYALGLNKRNKFLGVVWLQGESETSSSTDDPYVGYNMFEDFAQAFTEDINNSVASEQIALGAFSRNMWFNIDHTPARRFWQDTAGNPLQFARSHYYGGYKIWNPSTFIRLPANTGMNPGDEVHFGQNAFRITIAPLILQSMVDNGLFGGKPNTKNKFVRQISTADIKQQQGSINDEDIQNRLIAWFPFSASSNVGKNFSKNKDAVTVVNHGLQFAEAEGLIGPDKMKRDGKALVLKPSSGNYLEINSTLADKPAGWSVGLMLRRFNGRNNLKDQNLLLIPGTVSGLSYHRFAKECEGGYLTLSFLPQASVYQRLTSVTERLLDASYLRSNEEWVHLAYTFDNTTRVCKVYMNGELTMTYTFAAGVTVGNLSKLVLNDVTKGVDAQIRDLCIWDRMIPEETVFKVYLKSYFGGDANMDMGIDIGNWDDEELNLN